MTRVVTPRIRRTLALVAGLALIASTVGAAERSSVRGAETVGDAVAGIPVDVDMARLPVVPAWRPGDPIKEVPRRGGETAGSVPTRSARLDPLALEQRGFRGTEPVVTELLDFEATSSGFNPNDPTGDVGKDHFVQAINGPGGTNVTIYDKATGALASGPFTLDALAPSSPCTSGGGDPIVIYDPLAERWVLTEFTSFGNGLCVYTSRTPDPTAGSWCFYGFVDSSFPDYPKYAVWPDLYVATANQGNAPPVYAFDRVNMLSPDGSTCPVARATQKITGPGLPVLGFEAFTPVDLDGPPPPADEPAYLVRQRDEELVGDPGANPELDRVELWSFDVDFDAPGNTTLTKLPDIVVTDFDSNLCPPIQVFSCVPQPGTSTELDPLLEIVMYRVSYRSFDGYESLLMVFQTDVGDFEDHVGVRWVEARRSGGGDWKLHQEGTYSPDAEHRFMGMTAMDDAGNVLLAYNLSSSSVFPSIRYTGRVYSDPRNVMSLPEQTLVAGGGTNSSNRYGDYNQMGVDPEDGCTFWFLGMYNPSSVAKGVRVGAVQLEECVNLLFRDGFELGDTSLWGEVCVGGDEGCVPRAAAPREVES